MQDMEQGQPGRQPSGHEPRATRRFQRDAVVFEDYATYEGMVIPQGAIRARYCPETCPELPQKLARLSRGDTAAALAFVRTYGLLGYAPLAAAVVVNAPNPTVASVSPALFPSSAIVHDPQLAS